MGKIPIEMIVEACERFRVRGREAGFEVGFLCPFYRADLDWTLVDSLAKKLIEKNLFFFNFEKFNKKIFEDQEKFFFDTKKIHINKKHKKAMMAELKTAFNVFIKKQKNQGEKMLEG